MSAVFRPGPANFNVLKGVGLSKTIGIEVYKEEAEKGNNRLVELKKGPDAEFISVDLDTNPQTLYFPIVRRMEDHIPAVDTMLRKFPGQRPKVRIDGDIVIMRLSRPLNKRDSKKLVKLILDLTNAVVLVKGYDPK